MADKLTTVFGDEGGPSLPSVESRVPPNDMDAEAAVVSACMNDDGKAGALDRCLEMVRFDQFYSEAHRRIYEAITELAKAGTRPDVVAVSSWLRERDRLSQVGGMGYITQVLNSAPSLSNVEAYCRAIVDAWTVREAIIVCHRYLATGYGGYGKASEYVNGLSSAVFELSCHGEKSKVEHIGAAMHAIFAKVQAANAAGRNITGLSTGFDVYDRITSGLHDGELTIVAARPGMGKTSLVTNILTNLTAPPPGGWPEYVEGDESTMRPGVVFFSLEMPREQIVQRIMCSHARVEMAKMRTNMLTKTDWEKLTRAAGELHARGIFVDDQAALTLVELRSKLRRQIAEARKKGIKIVACAVDYLQLMKGTGNEGNREQEISGLSQGLKALAKELGIPFVVLAQLNRAVETRGKEGKRPQLSDLRESGAIEQDADNIVFIYREDYYNKDTEYRNIAELIIAKQRNGPTDTVRVRWDGMFTRFDNLADNEYPDYHGD